MSLSWLHPAGGQDVRAPSPAIHRLQYLRCKRQQTFYTEEHIIAYPVEYIAGIDLYNAGEYHAAHDAWEERWMGPVGPDEKLFLQAMIQSAVAFHHLQIGRPARRGACT